MISRTLGAPLCGTYRRRPPRFGLRGLFLDYAAEFRIGRRKLLSADGRRRAGRAQHAGDLGSRALGRLGGVGFRRRSPRTPQQLRRTRQQQAENQCAHQSSYRQSAAAAIGHKTLQHDGLPQISEKIGPEKKESCSMRPRSILFQQMPQVGRTVHSRHWQTVGIRPGLRTKGRQRRELRPIRGRRKGLRGIAGRCIVARHRRGIGLGGGRAVGRVGAISGRAGCRGSVTLAGIRLTIITRGAGAAAALGRSAIGTSCRLALALARVRLAVSAGGAGAAAAAGGCAIGAGRCALDSSLL